METLAKSERAKTISRWRFHDRFFRFSINAESFLDFLTDTPEVVRESILCELENISDFFGKSIKTISFSLRLLGIHQYRQQQNKTKLDSIKENENPIEEKMKEIESCMSELQQLIRDENS